MNARPDSSRQAYAWLACVALASCAHAAPAPVGAAEAPVPPVEGGLAFPARWCDGPYEPNHALGDLAKGPPRLPKDRPRLQDVARTVLHDAAVALTSQLTGLGQPAPLVPLLYRLTALSRADAPIRSLHTETATSYQFRFVFGDDEPRVAIVCSDVGCQLGVDVVPHRVRYNYATDASVGRLPSCDSRTTRSDFFDPRNNGALEGDALLHAVGAR